MNSKIHRRQSFRAIKTLTFALLFFSFSCFAQPFRVEKVSETFDVGLQIDEVNGKSYLVTTIELGADSYVVSPYSEDTIYGHFEVSIEETNHLIMDKTPLEIPSSVMEFDPILESQVRFVRENTTYKQQLKVSAKEDFEVSGAVWFVLEPSCKPYKVKFVISSHDGEITVEKISTALDY